MTAGDDGVGPVLDRGEVGEAVLAAIRKLDPSVVVEDRGSYVRVLAAGRCVARRADVESALGRPFALPGDLELVMPSFKGRLTMTDAEVVWTWKSPP